MEELGLNRYVESTKSGDDLIFQIDKKFAGLWMSQGDTTHLSRDMKYDIFNNSNDLEREILLALLAGPRAFEYPSYEEFSATVNIRHNIVTEACRTQLAFHTDEVNRPTDYWTYSEKKGFTILPGKPLVAALKKATQPDSSGRLYSFSCYRATEYVILLSIAQELAMVNPPLLEKLQSQWEVEAIMSGKFHDVFLREYGSLADPLPTQYYVPGDRVWFRNPDEYSSNISGYEGSWVFYLGGGLFSNFWKRDQPYTLTTKCIEIFHWRHGALVSDDGKLSMDEVVVETRTHQTLNDSTEITRILRETTKLRDPQGLYANGGCIDASREFPRMVSPGTADILLPSH